MRYGKMKRAVTWVMLFIMIITEGNALAGINSGDNVWRSKVEARRWFNGADSLLKKGKCAYVLDVKTGTVFRVKRLGGYNHMDMEPADRESGDLIKSLGKSWKARPAILHANGRYIACSINTMPHGKQSVHNNGFDGQFCLHMVGSKTHGGKKIRGDHQRAIKKAYCWAHRK